MDRPFDQNAIPSGPDRRAVLKSLGAAGILAEASSLLSPTPAYASGTDVPIQIDWHGASRRSKTTPTPQVVVNPLIRSGSPIHENVYRALRNLNTDYIRFFPWFPYPKLGVADSNRRSMAARVGTSRSSTPRRGLHE